MFCSGIFFGDEQMTETTRNILSTDGSLRIEQCWIFFDANGEGRKKFHTLQIVDDKGEMVRDICSNFSHLNFHDVSRQFISYPHPTLRRSTYRLLKTFSEDFDDVSSACARQLSSGPEIAILRETSATCKTKRKKFERFSSEI